MRQLQEELISAEGVGEVAGGEAEENAAEGDASLDEVLQPAGM